MSDQVQQLTPAQQQLANIQALATKQVESLLDATNAIRDIPKIFQANQSLAAERDALKAALDEKAALIAELESRLEALAPKLVEG
jgi:hypothetical protein